MKMYEIGKRYRWHREVGEWAHLNGTECTVIGEPKLMQHDGGWPVWAQATDTPVPLFGQAYFAFRGDLLPVEDEPALHVNQTEEMAA